MNSHWPGRQNKTKFLRRTQAARDKIKPHILSAVAFFTFDASKSFLWD